MERSTSKESVERRKLGRRARESVKLSGSEAGEPREDPGAPKAPSPSPWTGPQDP